MTDRTPERAPFAPAIGLVVGFCIGYVDSRPAWDDTGITAGAVFLAAALLAAAWPRRFFLTGLAVGLPVLLMNAVLNANFGSAVAVVIGLAGAGVGSLGRGVLGLGGADNAGV